MKSIKLTFLIITISTLLLFSCSDDAVTTSSQGFKKESKKQSETTSFTTTFFVGKVLRKRNGETITIAIGDTFELHDIIITQAKAVIDIQYKDRGIIRISELSECSIGSIVGKDSDETNLKFENGKVAITLSKLKKGTFKVKTPTMVAAVRGTSFVIESRGKKTTLSVAKGRVAVAPVDKTKESVEFVADTNSGEKITINEDDVVAYSKGEKSITPEPMTKEELSETHTEIESIQIEKAPTVTPEVETEIIEEMPAEKIKNIGTIDEHKKIEEAKVKSANEADLATAARKRRAKEAAARRLTDAKHAKELRAKAEAEELARIRIDEERIEAEKGRKAEEAALVAKTVEEEKALTAKSAEESSPPSLEDDAAHIAIKDVEPVIDQPILPDVSELSFEDDSSEKEEVTAPIREDVKELVNAKDITDEKIKEYEKVTKERGPIKIKASGTTTIQGEDYIEGSGHTIDKCFEGGLQVKTNTWLKYAVIVPESGYYQIQYRSAPDGYAPIIEFACGDFVKDTSIKNTKSSTIFATTKDLIYLKKGEQTIHITVKRDSFILNWIKLQKGDIKPIVLKTNGVTKIEAEKYSSHKGVIFRPCEIGSLKAIYPNNGDWIKYKIIAPSTGEYTIIYNYNCGNNSGVIEFQSATEITTSYMPITTRAAPIFSSKHDTVYLEEGEQTIQLYVKKSGAEINYFTLEKGRYKPNLFKKFFNKLRGEGSNRRKVENLEKVKIEDESASETGSNLKNQILLQNANFTAMSWIKIPSFMHAISDIVLLFLAELKSDHLLTIN